jgi:hypothetical protein
MADPGRRRRAVAATLAVLVVATTAWLATRAHGGSGRGGAGRGDAGRGGAASGTAGAARPAAPPPSAGAAPASLAAAESGLLPWHMAAPLSRAVAAAAPGRLLVFGGLTAGGKPADQIYAVRTATGTVRPAGTLTASLRAAAAAAAADGAAVSVGAVTYLVGGYDGSRAGAWVLATTDGRSYRKVAELPVPVRYPAVATLGGRIYAFGGQAVTGPHAGAPVSVIQAIDPARGTAAVAGDLPEPLAGAMAVTVGGELFVAGGESPAARRPVPGLGTTQLTGQPTASAGSAGGTGTVSTIWAYDPGTSRLLAAGQLQVPASHAAVVAAGATAWIVGGESDGALVSSVQMIRPDRAFGTAGAPGAGSPYFGARLLIADRANNRLLLLDSSSRVVWRYPSPGAPRFYYPDDAFFTGHGTAIISNQEENETIVKIAYPSGEDHLVLRPSRPGGHRPGVPARARRRVPAAERPDHGGGRHELPGARDQRQPDGRAPDRHGRRLRARPAFLDGLTERRHPAGRRQPAGLGDQRVLGQRVHPDGEAGVDRTAPGRLPLRPAADRPGQVPSRGLLRTGADAHVHA